MSDFSFKVLQNGIFGLLFGIFLVIISQNSWAQRPSSLGLVGDSGISGAVTDPELSLIPGSLGSRLFLLAGLRRVANELPPAPGGTKVYVLGAIDLLQAVSNEDLLDTEVPLFKQKFTCRQIRSGSVPIQISQYLTYEDKNIVKIFSGCKALFRPTNDPEDHKGFEFKFLNGTANTRFSKAMWPTTVFTHRPKRMQR